jgi:two-component system, probable response regulator PhcQ
MMAPDDRQLCVLFVDDDAETCALFRSALGSEFSVLTAASAAEALDVLRAPGSRVGVVVSDQRMPGESGSTFLTKVRNEAPLTVRILTTAYSDLDAAIESVNHGAIYKYVVKPWKLDELRATLRQAMEYRRLQRERDLLLTEKLATLRHLLVADRVRSLAVLARGLSHHIRNALTPLESHVYLAKAERDGDRHAEGEAAHWRELWTDAESVNRHLLDLVDGVNAATIDAPFRFDDQVELGALLASGQRRAQGSDEPILLEFTPPPRAVRLRCDAESMTRMFAALMRQMVRIGGSGTRIRIECQGEASVWGSPAARLWLRSHGDWPREAVSQLLTPFAMAPYGAAQTNSELLTAFFIVHHHGGTLQMHTRAPEGPGFELELPHDPFEVERPPIDKSLLDCLVLHAEDWARVNGE